MSDIWESCKRLARSAAVLLHLLDYRVPKFRFSRECTGFLPRACLNRYVHLYVDWAQENETPGAGLNEVGPFQDLEQGLSEKPRDREESNREPLGPTGPTPNPGKDPLH